MPLSVLIAQLQANQSKSGSFEHLANHLLKIANVPVRNIGSWAGNLMLTHDHDNFPSDVFTMMAGAGATLTLGEGYCGNFISEVMISKLLLLQVVSN